MKKNKMMRLASFLLVAVLLSTCAISGTFAKYTSTQTNSDTARVAKWSFTVGSADIAQETFVFDLFNTVYDTANVTDDDSVDNGTGSEVIIAPGTWGYFDLVLTNTSEVDAQYAIDYVVTANGIPVKFQVVKNPAAAPENCPTTGSWDADIADITASNETTLKYADADAGTKTVTYRIFWKWDIGSTDGENTTDTDLGKATPLAGITVAATITATQVD